MLTAGDAASIDEPLALYEGSGTSDRGFHISDGRGSFVAVTNASGAVIGVNTYDGYGRPGDDNEGAFQYVEQIWIEELGLYYKARF